MFFIRKPLDKIGLPLVHNETEDAEAHWKDGSLAQGAVKCNMRSVELLEKEEEAVEDTIPKQEGHNSDLDHDLVSYNISIVIPDDLNIWEQSMWVPPLDDRSAIEPSINLT